MIYYVLYILILVFAYDERFSIQKANAYKPWFYYFVFVLFLVGSLRWQRGTDWSSYYYFFLDPWTWWDTHFEVGYTLLNRIIRRFTNNYTVFLCIQNAVYYAFMISVFSEIQEEEGDESFFFLLLLYSYSQNFAGMYSTRSQIASILCLSAYCDLIKGRKTSFIFKTIIASSFHLMAIVFFVVFLIQRIKWSYWRFFLVLFIATLIILVSPAIVVTIMTRIPMFSRYATTYINSTSGNISVLGLAQWGMFLAVFIYAGRFSTNENYNTSLMIFTFGVAMYIWSAVYSFYFNRVAGIFLEMSIFMIPTIFKAFRKQTLLIFVVFAIYCFASFFTYLNGAYSVLFLPYKTIFDNYAVITDIL